MTCHVRVVMSVLSCPCPQAVFHGVDRLIFQIQRLGLFATCHFFGHSNAVRRRQVARKRAAYRFGCITAQAEPSAWRTALRLFFLRLVVRQR
jgi:hypothetical protein